MATIIQFPTMTLYAHSPDCLIYPWQYHYYGNPPVKTLFNMATGETVHEWCKRMGRARLVRLK